MTFATAKSSLMVLCACILATPAAAAVSGYYDSGEQIGVILADPDIADALRQAPIVHITNAGTREDGAITWKIGTNGCDVTVYLTATPPQGVGKTTYKVADIDPCE